MKDNTIYPNVIKSTLNSLGFIIIIPASKKNMFHKKL